jgi:hypothetical protein
MRDDELTTLRLRAAAASSRRAPNREFMIMDYVGFRWAAQIRGVVRRFESDAPVAA